MYLWDFEASLFSCLDKTSLLRVITVSGWEFQWELSTSFPEAPLKNPPLASILQNIMMHSHFGVDGRLLIKDKQTLAKWKLGGRGLHSESSWSTWCWAGRWFVELHRTGYALVPERSDNFPPAIAGEHVTGTLWSSRYIHCAKRKKPFSRLLLTHSLRKMR